MACGVVEADDSSACAAEYVGAACVSAGGE